MYVYYQHLKETYPDLHSKLKGDLETTAFSLGSEGLKNGWELVDTANKLEQMAKVEREKEQNFIQHTFGTVINMDINDEDDFKNFVDVFNETMQLEQVYQAHKTLIQADITSVKKDKETGKTEHNEVTNKNAYTYFSDYFAKTFTHKNRLNKMAKKVATAMEKDPSLSLVQVVRDVIDQEIPLAVDAALTKLETVGSLSKVKNIQGYTQEQDEIVKKGYEQIAKAINSMGKKKFGQLVIRELNLKSSIDKIIAELTSIELGENQFDAKVLKRAMGEGTRYYRAEGKNVLGGNMLELVENAVVNEMAKVKGKDYYVIQTGGTFAKPDNMGISVNIESKKMEQLWNDAFTKMERKSVSRKRNIEAMERLQESLDKLDASGYILYSSAKNQTLQSKTFKSGGFNSGTPMGISELQTVMDKIPGGDGSGLARAVMQTLKGAIGENERERLQTEIASYLAYFLFDDFKTIGDEIANSSKTKINCLHAMYLNGIYVPMSVLLKLLADAFRTESKEQVNQVAKVNIKRMTVKWDYENDGPPNAPGEDSMQYWNQQRDEVQSQMKITVRFLKTFKDLAAQLK